MESDAEVVKDALSFCCQHEFTTRKDVICCQGKNTDGTQCKAEIQKKSKVCGKCETSVDPQWFSSTVITCQGQRKDECVSGNILDKEEEFCIKCRTLRPIEQKGPAAKKKIEIQPAETCLKGEGFPMAHRQGDTNSVNNYFRTSKLGDQSYLLFHFHVLVSPDFNLNWERHRVWIQISMNDSESSMYKTFVMKHVRKVQGYEEMEISIKIEKQIVFGNGFCYNYARHNQKKQTNKFEKYYKSGFLAGSDRYCRLLDKWKNKSEYHQYDGIMNRDAGTWDNIKKKFSSDDIRKLEEDAGISAKIFTQVILLSTENMAAMFYPETLNMLDMLLLGLEKRYLQDAKCWSSQEGFRDKMTKAMLSHILESLESETGTPLFDYTETKQQAERRMQVALFVLSVIGRFKLLLSPHNKSVLARSLLLRPQYEKFHDLAIVEEKSQEERRKLHVYLIEFCKSFQTNDKDPSWLCCIPLLHLLSGVVGPYQPPTDDISHDAQKPCWWGIQSVKSTAEKFKECSKNWKIALDDIVRCLSPLFELDYFLPRTLMSVLQLSEVEKVIQTKTIPPEVCIATCSYYIKETRSNSVTEDKQIISSTRTLKEFLAKFEAPSWSDSHLHSHAYLTQRIAEDMVRITSKGRSMPDLLREVVQIFLEAVALFDTIWEKLYPNEPKEHQNLILKNVHDEVKRRFNNMNFSMFFSLGFQHSLKKWEDMLCSNNFKSPAVAEMWNNFIVDDFKKQWQNMKGNNPACVSTLVEQYCLLVDSQHLHPCMQSCLGDLALEVIPETYTIPVHHWGESEKGHFVRLLSSWYEREWEAAMKKKDMEEDKIILHHILNWMPFSHFLKMFYVDERKYLSHKCIEYLQRAISEIDGKIKALDNGEVTIRDLTKMKGADSNFQKLASFIIEKSEDEKKGKRFDIAKAVVVRLREVDCYKEQMKCARTLAMLCQHIPTVDLKDLDSIIERLTKSEDLRVKDICQPVSVGKITPDNYYPKITAFSLSDEVVNMLEPLQNLYESNIFINLWQEIGRQTNAASLEEVCEKVWKPVSSKVNEVTQILVTGEIQCREMELYLGDMYRDDYDKMVQDMISIKVPEAQAKERTKQLRQFRQLETYSVAAEAILDIVEAYELKGDFGVIKTIISKKLAPTMLMKEFNDSLFDTFTMLHDFTPQKALCLKVFIQCRELVFWLRESVKGVLKELKVFVDLASISAGEGDMEIAKVKCLHAAVTGYAPLIFDLDENSGYKKLLDKCQILWKELNADPKLPKNLQDTQRHLEWLKTVKQAHGSVEVTSLAQAEAINSKGIFLVGALETNGDTSMDLDLNSTLRLIVPDQNKDLKCHRWYTIEQLQDLQSRLMLIAWNAEQGKDDVDRFMLVSESMLRLATIFIKLNKAGCVLFRHWKTEFLCNPDSPVCALINFGQGAKPLKRKRTSKSDLTEVIPKLAGFMENCLEKWKDHIAKKRLKYFELNYFTTDQLVILQQELVKVTSDQYSDIRIYPLLSAVKENCTHEDLVDAMKKALTDIDKVQNEMEEVIELDTEENEQVKLDKQKEEEKVQIFIRAMIEAGNSEKHAQAALKHHEPSQIEEGVIWCLSNEEEMEIIGGDTGIAEMVKKVNEHAQFQGWKKSEQSVMSITADIINTLGVSERKIDVDQLIQVLEALWEAFLTSVSSSVRDYLSIEHLGLVLQKLAEQDKRKVERIFPGSLVQGTPNLILCSEVYLAELKRGSESTSSRMETVKSSKFDQNQSDEKARNRNENQTPVALVDKAHGTKSESEEYKSQASTIKLELGGKGSNITRTGNKGKSVDVIRVHFHSLVSAEFGLTSTDVVRIRFGDDELGGWQSDAHRPELVRKYGDEYTEFKLVLDIPKRLTTRHQQINYKYVIVKNKAHKDKAAKYMWELYGTYRSINRTLDLPDIKNIVHWYDGIILPKPEEGLWNTAKNFCKEDIKERVKRDLTQCIEYFLPKFFQNVSSGQLPEVSVDEVLNQLEDLLHSLKRVYCVDWECYSKPSDYERKVSTAIVSCIFKSLESEIETPLIGYIETQQQAERRMQVALFVFSVIGHFKLLLSPHNKSLLARSLLLRPHFETGTFHDLAVIVEKSQEERRKLQVYITQLCNSFQTNDKDPSWLCCIPLLHLLSGVVTPYQSPSDDISHDAPEPHWWGIQSVKSTAEKFKECSKDWMIVLEDIIRCLSPLFEVDYFLPRTLMYVLQLNEVETVIETGTIPPEVCIATCTYYIKETRSTLTTVHDQIISCTKMLKEFLAKFETPGRWSDSCLLQHAYLTQRIAVDMVRITFESLYPHDLIREVVQAFLEAVALYDITQEKLHHHEPKDSQIHILQNVHAMVKRWLSGFVLTCFTESLKRWQDMLCSKDFRSPVVAGMWNAFIGDDLKKQQEYKQLQDLLMLVAAPAEQGKDSEDRFSTVFMEFKTEVAEDVLNSIKITYGKKGIDSLVSSLKKFAKVDICDDRILVFCDSEHAEDVQECVTSHYNKAQEERTSPKETTNKYLINGGNDDLKEWLEFAFSHTSWRKNMKIEEDKLYLLGSIQMKREVDKAVQSKNHWYQEEFTLSSEEQQKANEVVAIVKNELPGVFIKLAKGKIEILSDIDGNIERAKYKVNMLLDRIKLTGRRRNQTNPQTYNKHFSDACMSEDDRMDAGLTLPPSSCHSNQPAVDLAAKSYCTKEGLTAKVYLGDLTSLPVDCIVNAANELLSHDGGVALAISKAAGRDFDQEGKEYKKKHGAIPVTQCCVTSPGKLPYKIVIHAVGPRWSDYKYNEKERCTEDLKKTIVNCLIEANKFKMASIAIPSLSSGIFGVPKPLCAQMYAQAVVEYSMTYGLQSVKEIHFVDMITDMCQLTKLAFDAELQ